MPQTLGELFFQTARRMGDKGAFAHKVNGVYEEISYRECAETVVNIAYGLHSLGVGENDSIAILSENRLEWALCDLAALSLGAVTVPIYNTLSPKQVERILNDSHSTFIAVSRPEHLHTVQTIFNNLKDLKRVITFFQPDDDPLKISFSLHDIHESGKALRSDDPDLLDRRRSELNGTGTATIIYTSGTTGEPKGVVLSHANLISNIKSTLEHITVRESDVFLSFLPLSHVFERMAGYYLPLYLGCTIAYAESFKTVGDNLREVRPTIAISVPRLYEKMYNLVRENVEKGPLFKKILFSWCVRIGRRHYAQKMRGRITVMTAGAYRVADKMVFAKLRRSTGGRIRYFVSGGAPLAKKIGEFFAYAGLTILEGYGLTETSPVIAVNPLEKCKFGTVGIPLPGIEVRIAADGEIQTRGPHVMQGYFNNPEATRAAVDESGWFSTGDIGFIDEEGYITITDRKKNIIVTSSGKNIAPQPIENLMTASRYIEQIVLIGDRRQFLSALIVPSFENLKDYLLLNGISTSSDSEAAAHKNTYELIDRELKRLSHDLSRYETIKKFFILDKELSQENGELTPTLKIKRQVVEEEYAREIEKLYSP